MSSRRHSCQSSRHNPRSSSSRLDMTEVATSLLTEHVKVMSCHADQIKLILNFMPPDHCSVQTNYEKSAMKAVEFRNSGNSKLLRNVASDYLEIVMLFTKSIAFSPAIQSLELAMGYSNRAIVLKCMGQYRESIADSQRALAAGYPENLHHKLYLRQGSCYQQLEQYGQALKSYKMAKHALENFANRKMSHEAKNKLENEIDANIRICGERCQQKEEDFEDLSQDETVGVKPFKVPIPSFTPENCNPEVPTASNAIELKYNKTYGRHFVATRDIFPGEVLIVEEPGAEFLLPQQNYIHCGHCFRRCTTLLPCDTCNWFMVCSQACAEKSKDYHALECKVTRTGVTGPGMECNYYLGVMARALTKHGLEGLAEYFTNITDKQPTSNEEKRTVGFNKSGQFISSDLSVLANLCDDNNKICETENEQISFDLKVCMDIALFMRKCKLDQLVYSHELAEFCFKFFCSVRCNGNGVIEYEESNSEYQPIAATVYPTYSLLNHSCNSNIFYHFYGRTIVVRAFLPIKKGSQVFAFYSKSFGTYDRNYRQSYLLKYFQFTCKCEACENDWPKCENLPKYPEFNLPEEEDISIEIQKSRQHMANNCVKYEGLPLWKMNSKNYPICMDHFMLLLKHEKLLCQEVFFLAESFRTYWNLTGNHLSDSDDSDDD